jgi:hypothetical protein
MRKRLDDMVEKTAASKQTGVIWLEKNQWAINVVRLSKIDREGVLFTTRMSTNSRKFFTNFRVQNSSAFAVIRGHSRLKS